ncbi:MAG: hypothetical protein JO058_06690 [Alphaproteobacteria bacterium]|nr:hypothetical protein [Alphaproteobacteria bacterium]MBV9151527.1 hypothetical protein [Alphaproteobacteria bacterium]
MPSDVQAAISNAPKPEALYGKLEDRILARDQKGASDVYYELVRERRPLKEIVAEAVRIHAPYTHVPYHERIEDGFVNFVNNDHCLLSARATLNLTKLMPEDAAGLPMAQTIWYIPTGLDIWNQKILKAPGHYARAPGWTPPPGPPPKPEVVWPDQAPEHLDGPLQDRLDHWMTLVHRGNVLEAYRVFLGLMQNSAERKQVLAQLCHAGLMDVQDRALYNRSYTTGHKAFRARATVELGNALGWESAHDVIYAGALDIAVGPRWYSTYEMTCNVIKIFLEKQAVSAIPYSGASPEELAILTNNKEPLSREESEALEDALIRQPEPGFLELLSKYLEAGKSPRRILDAMQIAESQIILETQGVNNFSLPQHCYEYLNTLGWFFDNFEHKHQIKLLYLAASYVNRAAWHQKGIGDAEPVKVRAAIAASKLAPEQILDRIDAAVLALNGPDSTAWTKAYLDSGADRGPLVQRLALLACRMGNDPHNQEIGQVLLEDYAKNQGWDRDRLLLAAAHHTAVHRKYGNPLDCAQRYGEALGIARLQ